MDDPKGKYLLKVHNKETIAKSGGIFIVPLLLTLSKERTNQGLQRCQWNALSKVVLLPLLKTFEWISYIPLAS